LELAAFILSCLVTTFRFYYPNQQKDDG